MIIEGTIHRPLVHQVLEVIPPREAEWGCYTAPAALYQIHHSLHQRQMFTEPCLMKNGNV